MSTALLPGDIFVVHTVGGAGTVIQHAQREYGGDTIGAEMSHCALVGYPSILDRSGET